MHLIPAQWQTEHLNIQDSVLSEVERLREVFNACNYVEKWDPTFHEESEAGIRALVSKSLENDPAERFRMQSVRPRGEETIIAYFHIYHGAPEPDLAWVSMFVIHPDYQRRRYGAELAEGLAEQLRLLGHYRAIRLEVYLKNWPALRFWIEAGFTTIIRYAGDRVYAEGVHASLVLEKRL
jgi:ribosomal protein S18 acetylase RimI-like enzyme